MDLVKANLPIGPETGLHYIHPAYRILIFMYSCKLIFGCTTITHHQTRRQSNDLLAAALDLGINHFDVARAYGAGMAEGILGDFIKYRRDQVIVTTKCGLPPMLPPTAIKRSYEAIKANPSFHLGHQFLRAVRNRLRGSLYSPARIRSSLETSLQQLQSDSVDYLLLHEAPVSEANRPRVIRTLETLFAEGKIKHFGIGSAFSKIAPYQSQLSEKYRVLQYEHSPFEPAGLSRGLQDRRQVFTHTAVKEMGRVINAIALNGPLTKLFGRKLDVDLSNTQLLPGLLLGYSHQRNPEGKVVFSTTSIHHLKHNIKSFNEFCEWDHERKGLLINFFDALLAHQYIGRLP